MKLCRHIWSTRLRIPALTVLVVSFMLFGAGKAYAELSVDSLLADYNFTSSKRTAILLLDELRQRGITDENLTVSETMVADSLRMNVWYWAAEYYYDSQRYERASDYALRALPLCLSNGNSAGADCANLLSIIYVRLGNLDSALNYAKICYKLDVESGDPDRISSSLNTLTSIYQSAKQPKEAEKYVLEGIEQCKKAGNTQRLAILYGHASEVYKSLNDYEKSLQYAEQSYQLEQKLGRQDKAAMRLTQMSSSLIALDRHREARKALEQAIPELEKSGNYHSLGIAYNQMGMLMHLANDDSTAIECYRKALVIFSEQHDIINESYSHKGLSDALRQTDPAEALVHNDCYQVLKDSIYKTNTSNALSQYTALYQNAQLEQRNKEQYEFFRNVIVVIFIILVLLMIGTYFGVSYYNRHSRKKVDRLLDEIETLNSKITSDTAARKDAGQEQTEQTKPDVSRFLVSQDLPIPKEEVHIDNDYFLKLVSDTLIDDMSLASNVEALSAKLNMTSQTFRRRLNLATGELPKVYLQKIQMECACRTLVTHPDKPIAEVAQSCGFSESSSFARTFRRNIGMTPTEYRRYAGRELRRKEQAAAEKKAAEEKAKAVEREPEKSVAAEPAKTKKKKKTRNAKAAAKAKSTKKTK